MDALAHGLPIRYQCPVSRIVSSEKSGVEVTTNDGAKFSADHVIVTVPLGVLKRRVITFEPPLPPRKELAIQRLGFGVLNKVALLFPHCFWGDLDTMGYLHPPDRPQGEFYLFYSYEGISGGSLLTALVPGDAAVALEEMSTSEAVRRLVDTLKSIFEPRGVPVPAPLAAAVTRWGQDPYAYGSYSSVAVGCMGGDEYRALAEPTAGLRVCFAGEATTYKYPATMHGAFCSGVREASRIHRAFERTVLGDKQLREGLRRAQVLASVDTAFAEAAAEVHRTAALAATLDRLFTDAPPDLEFGDLRAFLAPEELQFERPAAAAGADANGDGEGDGEGTGPRPFEEDERPALVRLMVGTSSSAGGAEPLPIYVLAPQGLVYSLQDARDAAARMARLLQGGVMVTDRGGLGREGEALVAALGQRHGVVVEGVAGLVTR